MTTTTTMTTMITTPPDWDAALADARRWLSGGAGWLGPSHANLARCLLAAHEERERLTRERDEARRGECVDCRAPRGLDATGDMDGGGWICGACWMRENLGTQSPSSTRVGRLVICTTCRRSKPPVGRDVAAAAHGSYCDRDCKGYLAEPHPDTLWPSEQGDAAPARAGAAPAEGAATQYMLVGHDLEGIERYYMSDASEAVAWSSNISDAVALTKDDALDWVRRVPGILLREHPGHAPTIAPAEPEAAARGERDATFDEFTDRPWRKRPIVVTARRMREPFSILTMEGRMLGKAGDWRIRGIKGEPYPCDDAIFRETYERADAPPPAPPVVWVGRGAQVGEARLFASWGPGAVMVIDVAFRGSRHTIRHPDEATAKHLAESLARAMGAAIHPQVPESGSDPA